MSSTQPYDNPIEDFDARRLIAFKALEAVSISRVSSLNGVSYMEGKIREVLSRHSGGVLLWCKKALDDWYSLMKRLSYQKKCTDSQYAAEGMFVVVTGVLMAYAGHASTVGTFLGCEAGSRILFRLFLADDHWTYWRGRDSCVDVARLFYSTFVISNADRQRAMLNILLDEAKGDAGRIAQLVCSRLRRACRDENALGIEQHAFLMYGFSADPLLRPSLLSQKAVTFLTNGTKLLIDAGGTNANKVLRYIRSYIDYLTLMFQYDDTDDLTILTDAIKGALPTLICSCLAAFPLLEESYIQAFNKIMGDIFIRFLSHHQVWKIAMVAWNPIHPKYTRQLAESRVGASWLRLANALLESTILYNEIYRTVEKRGRFLFCSSVSLAEGMSLFPLTLS